ncbi:hypothetical protein LTR37_002418 [Vermiconidia calcicola]|uniref:Uncharacterized protein n=1 Tax=Vermiconidia calcicola TaxID=1690605 RepID=A0ACC3NSP6_9PEZI|nr:hypothetical protein LTR37_002418 [Vermiconidia calcicola]
MARGGKKPDARDGKRYKSTKTGTDPNEFSGDTQPQRSIAIDLQQKCLDIFRDALEPDPEETAILQEVKGHLYDRNFAAAFGKDEYLQVYASRWSPSRALAYLQVFQDIEAMLTAGPIKEGDDLSIVGLGGGAGGELVALAGWFRMLQAEGDGEGAKALDVTLVDIADWSKVTNSLRRGITTPPELSKYASQAKKEANHALLNDTDMSVVFLQQNLLHVKEYEMDRLSERLRSARLITLMFTLNELYFISVASTTKLLHRITNCIRPGSCLLVVDSPGSYSTVSLNGRETRYPMRHLLEYTLLDISKTETATPEWEKVFSNDSRWFRLAENLGYPIKLEDMRYQIHVYRRLGTSAG